PYSDANGYFTAAIEQAYSASWNSFASRRPLAQAFRDVTIAFAGVTPARNLYIGAILVQLVLFAFSLYLAARAVVQWRGLWAGIAFCGLMLILARPFAASTLTEVLGLIWALLAFTLFVKGFRLQSPRHVLVGICVLTLALWTRMGSLLLLPILVVWFAWILARSQRAGTRLAALAFCAFGVRMVTSRVIEALYGSPGVVTGGNFAYSLCALAYGEDWIFCARRFADQLSTLPT